MTHKVRNKYENVQFNHDICGFGIDLVVVIYSVMSLVWSELSFICLFSIPEIHQGLPAHFRHVDKAVTQ